MAIVDKTKKNIVRCRCKFCPSFSFGCLMKAAPQMTKIFLSSADSLKKETHVENLFCAFEPSNCIKEKKGCKCPGCPVHKEYGLDKIYYCLGEAGE